jgi:hypothetical protein
MASRTVRGGGEGDRDKDAMFFPSIRSYMMSPWGFFVCLHAETYSLHSSLFVAD